MNEKNRVRPQCKRAFIFDMDGTLVDNMKYHTQAWLALFESLGIHLEADDFQRNTTGKTNPEILRQITGRNLSDIEIQDLANQKEANYRKLYRPHLAAINGLVSFLSSAKEYHIPMAVATSAGRQNIKFTLEGLQIKSFFGVVVGSEDILNGKPDPEIFLTTAHRLQVQPKDCIVFEDSHFGLEAADRAGMKAVLLTTSHQPVEMCNQTNILLAVSDFLGLDIHALLRASGENII